MRTVVTLLMIVAGAALMAISYFLLAAPIGQPVGPEYSNPRLLGAPLIFILGVMLIFLSAVAYQLIPDRVSAHYPATESQAARAAAEVEPA